MNHTIKYLILGLAVLGGLTACNKQLIEEPQAPVNTHRVYFSSSTAQTKTGITIAEGTMTPDWRKTDATNIHLFEIGSKEEYVEGEGVAITLSEENKVAHFKADFPTDMTIIVDPSKKNSTLLASNESNVGPYYYAAIVAQATESAYIVPAIQHPDTETLIDPSADFLIGYSRKSYDAHNWEEDVVDLYFDRPVALGRIIFSSFEEGEKVKSVVIKAPGLSGSTVYEKVDFENATVTFTPSEAEALTLDYGNGVALADGTFGAYFVALPGNALISEIVVTTDKYIYTKTVGKEIAFSSESFKNLKLDLASAEKQEVIQEEIKWYKASVLEDGIDYIIVSGGYALKNNDGTLDTVEISPVDGIITFDSAVDPTIVWRATAKVIAADDDLIAGHFTLSNGENMFLQRVSAGNHEYEMGIGAVPSTVKYYAWDYDGSYLYHVSNSSATFYCFYNSGWVTGYQNQKEVQIYTSRPPIEMSFSQTDVTFDKEGTDPFVAPILIKPDSVTEITYSSSNEAVASVDPATGEVTIKKAGTVTITATAAGNAEYQAGTASYTITVTTSNVPTWYKVEEIVAGNSYLLLSHGFTLNNNNGTFEALEVEISGDVVQFDAPATMIWVAEADGEYCNLVNGGKYLTYSGSDLAIGNKSSTADNNRWSYNGTEERIVMKNGSKTLYYSDSRENWNLSSSTGGKYISSLYSSTKQLQPQHLSFSSESVTAVLGQPFTAPTLSGVKTTVSYASSDANVATVASNGAVTLVGLGTTTITATAAASDEYNAGTASYTLKVTDGNVPTWYKADEIVAGETYMIISNGNALKLDGTSIATVADASFSGASFQYEEDENLIWTAAASSGKFTFKSGSRFISRSSTNISTSSSSGATFSYDGAQNYLMVAGSSNTYYLYYSESQESWMFSTSSGNTHTAAVYTMSPQLLPRNLAFSSVSVTHDLATQGTNVEEPTLSGVTDGVEYSSSNTSVATVNATTGEVTLAGITGSVVITASASKTDTYKAETVSYTIRVTDSSAPVTTATYTKVTSSTDLVAGAKYLLVYESGSKVFKPTLNGSNFATTGNALDVSITDETIVSDEYKDCQMTLEDGYYFYVASVSSYLYPTYNNMGAEETKSSSHSFNISINDGIATITRTSHSTTYYLSYSSSNSYFQGGSNSANVALYKLEENP